MSEDTEMSGHHNGSAPYHRHSPTRCTSVAIGHKNAHRGHAAYMREAGQGGLSFIGDVRWCNIRQHDALSRRGSIGLWRILESYGIALYPELSDTLEQVGLESNDPDFTKYRAKDKRPGYIRKAVDVTCTSCGENKRILKTEYNDGFNCTQCQKKKEQERRRGKKEEMKEYLNYQYSWSS